MSLTIWKAVIKPGNESFMAPKGAELLTDREQGEDVCIWFRCDPTQPLEIGQVEVCGTGHFAPNGRYLGSAHFDGGTLVLHVFEADQVREFR